MRYPELMQIVGDPRRIVERKILMQLQSVSRAWNS